MTVYDIVRVKIIQGLKSKFAIFVEEPLQQAIDIKFILKQTVYNNAHLPSKRVDKLISIFPIHNWLKS